MRAVNSQEETTCFVLVGSLGRFSIIFIICAFLSCIEAGAYTTQLITFEEYPVGAIITDQYRDQGVVFSGDPQNQYIRVPPPIFGSGLSQTLMVSYVTNNGLSCGRTMTISFVLPGTDIPAAVSGYGFNSYFQAHLGEDYIFNFYPVEGEPIVKTWWDLFSFNDWPTVPITEISMTPEDYVCVNLFLENLRFRISCDGTDADGDGHYTPTSCLQPNDDCDDSNPAIPGAEICSDGKDNDCDGLADCIDSECSTNAQCFPRNCADSRGLPSSYVGE